MKQAFITLIFTLALTLQAFAQLSQCTVTATIYLPSGAVCNGCTIKVVKVYKSGQLVIKTPQTYTTNGSGVATFTVPRSSIAWIYANAYGLDSKGVEGVPVSIPDSASATLETLTPTPAPLPNFYPVASGGSGGTLDSLSDVTITSASTGQALVYNGSAWVNTTLPGGGDALTSNPLSQFAATTSAQLAGVISNETGSGLLVFATSPTLTTPNLGTPSAATLTNATGLPVATGISGLGTGVATFLATPSSANLAAAITDETGTGALVLASSPTIVTPTIASFANANHDHTNSAGGGQLSATSIFSGGTVPVARLPVLVGDSGSGGTAGIVPAPAAGDAAAAKFLMADGTWAVPAGGGGGSGTVTSVAMTVPSWLSVSGSPITTSGTLAVTAATGQAANRVLATPNGASGALSVRALVSADLGAIVTNSNIDAAAAIDYSKLNLSLSVVNADIASAAAISLSKLATVTASRALVSSAGGVISASGVTSTELGYLSGVTSAIQTQLDAKENLLTNSAGLRAALSDETGSGVAVFGTAPTIAGGSHTALTALGIRSTGTGAFDLTLANSENLTAGRTLTVTVNDAARTLNLGGDLTTAAAFITSGANSLTLTTTGATNVTLPTSGTLVNSAVTALSSLATVGTITSGTLGTGAVIGGVTMTLGSDATGDLYYRNASGILTRLGIGTTGQVLTVVSGLPAWAAASGGGSSTWNGVTNPTGNQTLSMSNYTTAWTWGAASGVANAEQNSFLLDFGRTITLTGGGAAIANWRTMRINPETLAAASAQTITTASTLYVAGPPAAGANVTITNPYSLLVDGNVRLNSNSLVLAGPSTSDFRMLSGSAEYLIRATAGTVAEHYMLNGIANVSFVNSSFVSVFTIMNTNGLVGVNKSSSQGGQFHVLSGSASRIAGLFESAASNSAATLVARAGSSATGPLIDGQNSSSTVTFRVNSDGTRLSLGGVTSSFPMLKRSGASIQARLADDSALTDVSVATLYANGLNMAIASETFAGDKTDWQPANPSAAVFRITPSGAARTLNSINLGPVDGQMIWIINVDTTNNLVLDDASASGTAAMRIIGIGASDVTLTPGQTAQLIYDGTTARWRVINYH
ncbi:MAG: beta strand repeat-containing protein [Arenimonas sp.]